MPGFVHGFHEGSRGEYLAAYVFSAFGTASPIPHQEDHGFDLYCTLAHGDGNTRFAAKPYTVQVKSTRDPWTFEKRQDVEWFVDHPLPLFLCIVDKKLLQLTIFQTTPKFYYWSLGGALALPECLKLCPNFDKTEGICQGWQEPGSADLSAPILDFKLDQLSDSNFFHNIRAVLDSWIELDYENLFQITTGTRQWMSPGTYQTNDIIDHRSSHYSGPAATPDEPRVAMSKLKFSMAWVMKESMRFQDWKGALRVALLLRYFCRGESFDSTALFCSSFDHVKGVASSYVYETLDQIAKQVDANIPD